MNRVRETFAANYGFYMAVLALLVGILSGLGAVLLYASRKMALKEIGRLPVVDGEDLRKVIGIITRSDIVGAYNRHLLRDEEPGGDYF